MRPLGMAGINGGFGRKYFPTLLFFPSSAIVHGIINRNPRNNQQLTELRRRIADYGGFGIAQWSFQCFFEQIHGRLPNTAKDIETGLLKFGVIVQFDEVLAVAAFQMVLFFQPTCPPCAIGVVEVHFGVDTGLVAFEGALDLYVLLAIGLRGVRSVIHLESPICWFSSIFTGRSKMAPH